MSGVVAVAIEKPSRARIPDEYVFTGASMNGPISANSMIVGVSSAIWRASIPRKAPTRSMLSRPVSSISKPAPRVSRVETRPCVTMSPSLGWRTPARASSRVLLPAPFGPMTASDSPWARLNVRWRIAQKSVSVERLRRSMPASDPLSVVRLVSRRS